MKLSNDRVAAPIVKEYYTSYFTPTAKPKLGTIDIKDIPYKPLEITGKIECPNNSCKGHYVGRHNESVEWGRCEQCGFLIWFFNPTPIQQLTLFCENFIVAMGSGTGAGKTLVNAFSLALLLYLQPGSRTVITSTSLDHIQQVVVPELKKFIPAGDLVTKNTKTWELRNGSTINFKTPRKEKVDALKGETLKRIWIVEAQAVSYEFFVEAQNRIRGLQADSLDTTQMIEEDGRKTFKSREHVGQIIVEFNVRDDSWTGEHLVFKSHTLIATKSVCRGSGAAAYKGYLRPVKAEGGDYIKDIVTFLWTPEDNPYLTTKVLNEMKTGKDKAYVDREFYADLRGKAAQVLYNFVNGFISYEELPDYHNSYEWQFVEGLDFSLSPKGDPTAYVLGIFNPKEGKLIILDGFSQRFDTFGDEVEEVKKIRAEWGYHDRRSAFFVADPSGFRTTKSLAKNIASFTQNPGYMLKRLGLRNIMPAFGGDTTLNKNSRNIEVGVDIINKSIEQGELKILDTLGSIYEKEVKKYVRREYKAGDKKSNLPIDKHNHFADALRYLVVHCYNKSGFKSFETSGFSGNSNRPTRVMNQRKIDHNGNYI